MLADSICNALCFDFFCSPVYRMILIQFFFSMEFFMCHLMDHCLDGLQLAHIRFDDYLPVSIAVIALGSVVDILCVNRYRAHFSQSVEKLSIASDVTGEFIHTNCWQLRSFCLRIIKDCRYLESSIFSYLLIAVIVLFFKFDFVLAWSDYLDAFFAFSNLSAMILLPCLITCN